MECAVFHGFWSHLHDNTNLRQVLGCYFSILYFKTEKKHNFLLHRKNMAMFMNLCVKSRNILCLVLLKVLIRTPNITEIYALTGSLNHS